MNAWNDDRIRRAIGTLMRWGVVLTVATAFAGGVMYLRSCGAAVPDYSVFRGEPPELRTVAGIAREAFSLNPLGLIQFGLLLLIAIPLARIAFSLVFFVLQGDLVYVAATLVTLSVVLLGLAREGPGTVVPPDRFRPMCTASDGSLGFFPDGTPATDAR